MPILRVIPERRPGGRADAVVLHGMFSGAGSMAQLTRALQKREHYRHVARFDLPSWRHRFTPQVFAEENAAVLASKKIRPALNQGKLAAPLDLIGHSNGGYVCLYLAAELGPKIVRSVYTLGTPRGLPKEYSVPTAIHHRVYHLRGGNDGVPVFGGSHNPGDGEWVVTFPDEGHCSLHSAADTNGVADIISYLAGMDLPHIFWDDSGTIHPWEWCRDEAEPAPRRVLGTAGRLTVCDGMHDAVLDRLKVARRVIGAMPIGGTLAKVLGARLGIYLAIRARLVARQESLDEALSEARAYGRELKDEVATLQAEDADLARCLVEFERRATEVVAAFKRECRHDVERLSDAFDTCTRLAKGPTFGNREMAEVNALLEVALTSHRRLNERVQDRARLPGPGGAAR
jgi:pimeloyl-ACP methyl ester carboxylesterase